MENQQNENNQQQNYDWNQQFSGLMSQYNPEKALSDKLLGRKDVERLAILMKKDDLDRSDLLELLYMLGAVEIKLSNLGEWDRYLLGKFYAWIRDFVNVLEVFYDYRDKQNKTEYRDSVYIKESMENIRVLFIHNTKFLVDVYLYLSRSTLSLGMSAFDSLSKMRYEYDYGNQGPTSKPEGSRSPLNLRWS